MEQHRVHSLEIRSKEDADKREKRINEDKENKKKTRATEHGNR